MTNDNINQKFLVEKIEMNSMPESFLPEWKEWHKRVDGTMFQDPEWLLATCKGGNNSLYLFAIRNNGALISVLSFTLAPYELLCRLGEFTIVKFQLRRLSLQGGSVMLPEETRLYDLLFNEITLLINKYDAIFMEGMDISSAMWKYLKTSTLIKKFHRVYLPVRLSMRPMVKVAKSFDDYVKKFHRLTRKKIVQRIHKLEKIGDVKLKMASKVDEIDAFVDEAVSVSLKTYQYHLLGRGVRDPETTKKFLRFVAKHGWLRSYLLRCGGVARAFLIGYQDGHTYYPITTGYDADWSKYGVGQILFWYVLKDIHTHNAPQVFDLHDGAGFKQFFANSGYMQSDLYLFHRTFRTFFISIVHATISSISSVIVKTLEFFNINKRIKRAVRMRSLGKNKEQ